MGRGMARRGAAGRGEARYGWAMLGKARVVNVKGGETLGLGTYRGLFGKFVVEEWK